LNTNARLLIDFSPLKAGGGVQIALNFLDYISQSDEFSNVIVLISDKFPLTNNIHSKFKQIVLSSSPIKRILAENFKLKKVIEKEKITHIFTFFGPGLPKFKNVRQIVSVAYPIICYDDSPYWEHISFKVKVLKKIYNIFRLNRISKADSVIVETTTMQSRLAKALKLPPDHFKVISPVPTSYVKNNKFMQNSSSCRFLVLSGLAEHKNIWRLIGVATIAQQKRLPIKFIITCDKSLFVNKYKKFLDSETDDILTYFEFKGSVPQDKIQQLYNSSDALINISDLESFSNNYMEAWLAAKPIIASDRDFSHNILGESALYVDPHDCDNIFDTLNLFINDSSLAKKLTAKGKEKLKALPSIEKRWAEVKEIIFKGS
jgi:glycosyltransferase involved in cell wall biosynthesis